jgi:hypothetical protein
MTPAKQGKQTADMGMCPREHTARDAATKLKATSKQGSKVKAAWKGKGVRMDQELQAPQVGAAAVQAWPAACPLDRCHEASAGEEPSMVQDFQRRGLSGQLCAMPVAPSSSNKMHANQGCTCLSQVWQA